MANSGAFTSGKHWNDVNAGLRAANAGQLINRIRAAMVDLDESTANDYLRVLNIDSNAFGVMPGNKGHRDRVRAALLIKLLIGETNTADAPKQRTNLLAKSDGELDRLIVSDGAFILVDPTGSSTTPLPTGPQFVRPTPTLTPTPVKKLTIPAGFEGRYAQTAGVGVSTILGSDMSKSLLDVKLKNPFGDEFRLDVNGELSKYRSSIQGMAVGVDVAYKHFETAMAKDAQQEKAKYDMAISIIKSGLAAVGAGPLALIGAAIVGNLAKHVYAGISSMVSSDTLNSGATSGINAVVDEFGGLVEFSQGQQDLWAQATRVVNVQSVNQSAIAKAASSFKDTLLKRSLDTNGIPGSANLQVTLLARYDEVVQEMNTQLKMGFVKALTGTGKASLGDVVSGAPHDPYQLVKIFVAHVVSSRPDLVAQHKGGMAAFDTYLNEVVKQVYADWKRLFPSVTPINPADAASFASLCEAKMWCRIIVNEQERGRKPRDAVIDRLDALGIVGKWSQSALGAMRISRGRDTATRMRIYGEGRLRYHGSDWEVAELRKLASWIDNDRNVNIPALAAGVVVGGVPGVWKNIRDYNMLATKQRDGL